MFDKHTMQAPHANVRFMYLPMEENNSIIILINLIFHKKAKEDFPEFSSCLFYCALILLAAM